MTDDAALPVQFSFELDADAAGPVLKVDLAVSADVTVELGGITVVAHQIRQPITLNVGHGDPTTGEPVFGFWPSFGAPTLGGAAVTVDLPVVTGSGELDTSGDSWVGALQLQIGTLSVDAFAVLTGASHGDPMSFVVVLCARFPAPGIQIGFGFAVSGVGGVFGLNRRTDPDALSAAVLDHSLAALLFAHDAKKDDAQRVAANLPALFPPAKGQLIVGPMFELTWADGLLTADLLMLLELPDPLRISFLGRLAVDLPVADAAIIHIEAMVMATVTPGIPEFRMVASLTGSRIAFFTLTGDLFLLIRGGPEATFILSAGGFHPAVHPPPASPPLKRLGMVMGLSFIELRCESYLAVTTASVQFGALVELNAHIAGCAINAHLGFDALIEWEPEFHLRVDVHAGLSVEIAGEHICGVTFDGYLEGPGPWHLHGRAEVELLFFSVPIPIDATFGSGAPMIDPAPDVGKILRDALAQASAWTIRPPHSVADGVVFSGPAQAAVAAGTVLHPSGGLQVLQHAVPLEMIIDRFGGQSIPEQSWAITGVALNNQPDADHAGAPKEVADTFADGTFRSMTVDEQLSSTGFTPHAAGAQIRLTGLDAAPAQPCPVLLHDVVWGPDQPILGLKLGEFGVFDHIPLRTAAIMLTAPGAPVTVAAEPPTVVIVNPPAGGVPPAAGTDVFATRSAALDRVRVLAASGQAAQVVEHWELP